MKHKLREPSNAVGWLYSGGVLLIALALAVLHSLPVSANAQAMFSAVLGLVLIFCALKAMRNFMGVREEAENTRQQDAAEDGHADS